jgi:hypothetical protein
VAGQDVGAVIRRVLLSVDAVVHHDDALRINRRIGRAQVPCHAGGHRDDRVGGFDGRALAPGGQRIAAAELLRFPGPQRLEAVGGDDVRHSVQEFGQVAGEVRVPGVAVHQVGAGASGGDRHVDPDGAQGRVRTGQVRGLGVAGRLRFAVSHGPRSTETPDVYVHQRREVFGKVFGVHAGSAVDVRRVLAGQHIDAQRASVLVVRYHVETLSSPARSTAGLAPPDVDTV